MRNVKFRAWLNDLSRMIVVRQIDFENQEVQELILKNPGHEWVWHQNFELLQFIGQSDKNCVDIYEGDVIGRNNYINNIEIGTVIYEDCCFVVDRLTDYQNEYIEWPTEFFTDCEVLGNIYSNPELIKIKKDTK